MARRAFHALTVEECWQIARRYTEAYQRNYARAEDPFTRAMCLAARDAADKIALRIRHGTTGRSLRERKRKKR